MKTRRNKRRVEVTRDQYDMMRRFAYKDHKRNYAETNIRVHNNMMCVCGMHTTTGGTSACVALRNFTVRLGT